MPSTVYKGDIAEVAFGTEAGMILENGAIDSVTVTHSKSGDISTFTFSTAGATTGAPFDAAHVLKYPRNMLVGSQLICVSSAAIASIFDTKDDAKNGRVFTITANSNTVAGSTIDVTPALFTATASVLINTDAIVILPYKTPAMNAGSVFNALATTSSESVLTDQFLGLTSALTLPETKVDLKRFHVVGLGRDVSVQAPGKFITEGGSFEVAMHTARWLKYCLGHELVDNVSTPTDQTTVTLHPVNGASNAGDSHLNLSLVASSIYFTAAVPIVANLLTVGDYIHIVDTATVELVSDHEPGTTPVWNGTDFKGLFDLAQKQEIRRIVAFSGSRIFLNQPLDHPHNASTSVKFLRYQDAVASHTDYANPLIDATTKVITRPITHLLYSKSTLPSFSLEVSHRRRDIDSDEGTTDGGSGDSKELNRIYRGCKVTDFTLTTDNDAALRLSVNFNSALCYTDTGRLEATPGSRYAAHRMFDDTANTKGGRYISGIGAGTQKPFMFYNGSIDVAGQKVGQVLNFTLTGQTGVQSYYAVNGNSVVESDTDQVPFGGSRNPFTMIEGQTTYDLTMEIIVDDPVFFHKMRTSTEFFQNADKQIVLSFEKGGAAGDRGKLSILIDDYYIVEAPLQIPEDKGPIKSTLKIMPKSMKVVSRDTILQY